MSVTPAPAVPSRLDAAGPLGRADPLATLGAALALAVVCVASLDLLTPVLSLAVTLAVVPFSGVPGSRLARDALPLAAAATLVGLVNLLTGAGDPGRPVLEVGPVVVGTADLRVGLATALRVLAIALPGVVAFAATDPTDVADSLVRHARVPVRVAYGALASLRLVPLLAADWQTLQRATRARGLGHGGPVARLRRVSRQVLGLLVSTIRRATRLATAMDARGFDAAASRTYARPCPWRRSDTGWLLGGVLAAAAIVAVGTAAGTARPLWW